jgi:hypothetical protein
VKSRALVVVVALAIAASTALASGGPVNLVAKTHSTLAPTRVKGPLKRTTYYGRYHGVLYAVATFSIARLGTTDQPELFRRVPPRAWRDLGDTGGEVCPPVIPLPLIQLWGFVKTSYSIVKGKRVYCYAPRR